MKNKILFINIKTWKLLNFFFKIFITYKNAATELASIYFLIVCFEPFIISFLITRIASDGDLVHDVGIIIIAPAN